MAAVVGCCWLLLAVVGCCWLLLAVAVVRVAVVRVAVVAVVAVVVVVVVVAAEASHDSPRAQTCTLTGPRTSIHPSSTKKKTQKREERKEHCGGRVKNKARNFGPTLWGPTLRNPTTTHTRFAKRSGQNGLAEIGFVKIVFGQNCFWPNWPGPKCIRPKWIN